jgi:hypothetical protein
MSTLAFVRLVLPALFSLAEDLFALTEGDATAAVLEIEDYRAQIATRVAARRKPPPP